MTKEKHTTTPRFRNLDDIAARKAELRRQISRQEKVLNQDFAAYQEDVDTFKRIWNRIVGILNFRKHKDKKPLLYGLSNISAISSNSGWMTALTIGAKVIRWLWKRKH